MPHFPMVWREWQLHTTSVPIVIIITLEEHPLDEQSCKLYFASWVYDGFDMDIDLVGVRFSNKLWTISCIGNEINSLRKPRADTYISNKWEITKNTAALNFTCYRCCKEPIRISICRSKGRPTEIYALTLKPQQRPQFVPFKSPK